VGAHEKVLELYATKKVLPAQIDEIGLSVLIKACDRLGDAEWAVTILKEAIKAVSIHYIPSYILPYFMCVFLARNRVQDPLDRVALLSF
jgi:aminopeptidase N